MDKTVGPGGQFHYYVKILLKSAAFLISNYRKGMSEHFYQKKSNSVGIDKLYSYGGYIASKNSKS